MFEPGKHIFFVGIGGAGMSSIAHILLSLGFIVSGSDLYANEAVHRLKEKGARIYDGHSRTNISLDIDTVVISSAIPKDNPEVLIAKELGINVIRRAEMLDYLMSQREGIAVTGAHGKTTTTSMISMVMEKNGYDPTVLIGGELNDIGGNAKLGLGKYLVAEADESDGSFLCVSPKFAVITNIDNDHLDYYKSMKTLVGSFMEFIERVVAKGYVAINNDNLYLSMISKGVKNIVTFGMDNESDVFAKRIRVSGNTSSFDCYINGHLQGEVSLKVPGKLNIYNALGCIAILKTLGMDFDLIKNSLDEFTGVQRRFQIIHNNDFIIVDDYGHHPTEIAATISAAKSFKAKRLRVIFQPHRYSRTQILMDEFPNALDGVDELILTSIYGAGEDPIPGITSEILMEKFNEKKSRYIATLEEIIHYLDITKETGDMIITLGAGDIWKVSHGLNRLLR